MLIDGVVRAHQVIRYGGDNKTLKLPRIVRMHADELEDVDEVGSGEIVAMFGVECSSGTTFCHPDLNLTMTSIHVTPHFYQETANSRVLADEK